jgi:hypothetical protein
MQYFSNTVAISFLLAMLVCFQTLSASGYFHSNQIEKLNKKKVGTCREFLKLNNLTRCCTSRNDQCFMIHNFNDRCYCDDRCTQLNKRNSDCCEDASFICSLPDRVEKIASSAPTERKFLKFYFKNEIFSFLSISN